MQPLTPEQLKKLKTLKRVMDMSKDPKMATLLCLKELEDRVEAIENTEIPEAIRGEDGSEGEKGERGTDGKDGRDGQDGKNGKDGKDGRDGKDGQAGVDGLNGSDGKDGKDGSPDTPIQIVDKLETLKGDDRLDKKAIRGLDELEKKLDENKNGGVRVIGGRAGVQLYVDGEKQGLVQTVNLIAGAGVVLTYNRNSGRNDITISNDSVEGTVLEATGTVNGTNTVFTFTSEPSVIVTDGTPYRKTNKLGETIWTWSSPTATLTIPPQSDVYGLR